MRAKMLGGLALAASLLASTAVAFAEDVTVRMLYIGDTKAYNEILQGIADTYMKANPGVKIVLMPMENEALKAKLPTMLQSDDAPDIFTSWGGGVMLAHEQAGYLADLTAEKDNLSKVIVPAAIGAFQVDGKQVGLADSLSLVSVYVNKPLLAKANVSIDDLKTWDGFKGAVTKLRAAGITPVLTGGKDEWPLQFYLGYLLLREGGGSVVADLKANGFNQPVFLKAAQELVDFGKLNPFQDGWLSKTWPDSAGQFGDSGGAMYLMGNWIISQQAQDAKDGKGISAADLGIVPFPTGVPGGKGTSETLGGIAGYEVNAKAPSEAAKFLEFYASREQQKPIAQAGLNIPSAIDADQDLKDPQLREIAKQIAASPMHQNFLDQDLGPDVGRVMNDVATALVAGSMTPEDAAKALQEAWDNSK